MNDEYLPDEYRGMLWSNDYDNDAIALYPWNPARQGRRPSRIANEEYVALWVDIAERPRHMELELQHTAAGGGTEVTLLIPDQSRENREDFVWCHPVERVKFNKWYALAKKFKGIVPKEHGGGVHYMHRYDTGKVKTIIAMPNGEQSDEDAQAACAWLRLVKGFTCRMYIVRCTDDPLKGARLINAAAGADPAYLHEIQEGEERGTNADGTPRTTAT